ncbi:MAG: tol-pal system protein YbgF [Desulfuromonadales bacterium]
MSLVRYLIILLTGFLLSSCVVTQQDLQMQRDLLEMKRRLGDAERTVKELKDDTSGGVRAHVETLARNQADFQAELDGVRVDLQSMQGRTGDQERINDNLRQDQAMLRDELSMQIADHEQRLAKLEASTIAVSSSAPVSPVGNASAAAGTAAASTPAEQSALALYEQALKKIREEQDFTAGRELMETFLKRYPGDELAVNAAYWVGETHYAQKAYEKAILRFEDVIQKYGEHPKVASAMLKQALAFEASGDKATGRLLLQSVIERFPLSDEANKARQILQGK